MMPVEGEKTHGNAQWSLRHFIPVVRQKDIPHETALSPMAWPSSPACRQNASVRVAINLKL
jgi:hypothetical protein